MRGPEGSAPVEHRNSEIRPRRRRPYDGSPDHRVQVPLYRLDEPEPDVQRQLCKRLGRTGTRRNRHRPSRLLRAECGPGHIQSALSYPRARVANGLAHKVTWESRLWICVNDSPTGVVIGRMGQTC